MEETFEMNDLTNGLFWCLIIWTIIQGLLAIGFFRRLHLFSHTFSLPDRSQSFCPSATIILCLRGADPFLFNCLTALLQQDYPHYRLQIIIDSITDPAWDRVTQFLADHPTTIPIQVQPLNTPKNTCSLKCSALIQAIDQLDPDCEVVAFIDADTIAHPTWLRELTNPLQDDALGGTTGNRWYSPSTPNGSEILRYLWNLATVIQMTNRQIPWGGTLALKTQVLRQTNILDLWAHALSEDVLLHSALRSQGLKMQFIPSLLMVNRESCHLASFLPWMQRQFLLVRLYHPAWRLITVYGSITLSLLLGGYFCILSASIAAQWHTAIWIGMALLFNWIISALVTITAEQQVRKILSARGESLPPIPLGHWVKIIAGIPIGLVICNGMLLLTNGVQHVTWRGVVYQILKPWHVQMNEYSPYQTVESSEKSTVSL
jgi:cellulose synthase/poly-beta-1,6-N-acetylglucosamine synthase-like glycosyltransferase